MTNYLSFKNRNYSILKVSIFFMISLLVSCSTESQTDYVDLQIPAGLTNKEAIASLKKDEKQLNKVFNSMEDGMKNMIEIGEIIERADENSTKAEIKKEVIKASKKLNWSMAKAMYNGMYFLVREEVESKSKAELLAKLSAGEQIEFTKSVKHIRLKKEVLKANFEKYTAQLDSMLVIMEEKEALFDKMK